MVCGLAADSSNVHQADIRLPAMRLRSLTPLSCLLVQPDGQDCSVVLRYAFHMANVLKKERKRLRQEPPVCVR